MRYIYRKYGKRVECTTIEKESAGTMRVSVARARGIVYGERRPDNVRRTKQICMRRVLSAIEDFGSPLLFTFTLSGISTDICRSEDLLRSFTMRLRGKFKDAEYIIVPELSPRGRIHYHGLIFGLPMYYGDRYVGGSCVEVGVERKRRTFAKMWRAGFVDCRQTDGSGRLATYLVKYLMKSANDVFFAGIRMIKASRGIGDGVLIKDNVGEMLVKRYADYVPEYKVELESPYHGNIKRVWYNMDRLMKLSDVIRQ